MTSFTYQRLRYATVQPQMHALINHFLFIVLAVSILLPSASAIAATASAAGAKAKAQTLTNSLVTLHGRYQRAEGGERAQVQAELVGVAAERRKQLASLIENNVADVLQLAISPAMRAGLPAAAQAYVEEHVQLDGDIEVRYEDYDKFSKLRHFLHANGKAYSLHFSGEPPEVLTGAQARVKAVRFDTQLLLESGSGSTTTSMLITSPALTNTFGAQNTAVILVNFQDNLTQPYTYTQVWNTIFGTSTGSASDYMREVSFQQTWLSGNVYGWYTLPIASTCVGSDIANYAKAAASAAGVNLSAFNRFVYVFPRNTTCGWSGMGTVGGWPSDSWINGNMTTQVVTHELGHNYGLQHSHAQECGATTLGTSCTSLDYGDTLDTMGNSNPAHYNAFQKELLGWLNYGSSPPIVTVQSGGSFSIEPYETASSGTKALKVLKSTDPTTGLKSWYYVEYRQAVGFDGFLAGYPSMLSGVVIRSGTDANSNSSFLLDMTPSSSTYYDWNDTALTVGQSFTDAANGVTITTTAAGGAVAGVTVSYGGTPTCNRANPTVALTPGQSASVAAGTAVTFTVTVTNKDSSGCSASSFNLSSAVPSGWSGNLGTSSLSLAPGASGTAALVVTSSTSAVGGYYSVSSSAVNSAQTNYAGSGSATYVVAASTSTNQSPVAVGDSATTLKTTPVTVAVLSNDYDPEGKPLSLVSVTQPANGSAVVNANGTVTYTAKARFKGSDSFSYTISDGIKTASATVSMLVKAK